jgi:hypothetical protein
MVAFKVFLKGIDDISYWSEFLRQGPDASDGYFLGKTYKDTCKIYFLDDHKVEYLTGFHAWKTLEEALKWKEDAFDDAVIVKVEITNITYQGDYIVGREMTLLEEINENFIKEVDYGILSEGKS